MGDEDPGDDERKPYTEEQKALLDKLAEQVRRLSPDRQEALLDELEDDEETEK